MKLEKLFLITLISILIITGIPVGTSAGTSSDKSTGTSADTSQGPSLGAEQSTSPPISRGTINTFTDIYWGKNELFPVVATVFNPTQLDVYEYDKDWVMVLYDTTLYIGNDFYEYSIYGYVKRSEITCDPELEGDASEKAVTSPNKRPKKPKNKSSQTDSESTRNETSSSTDTATTKNDSSTQSQETTASGENKEIPVDKLEEYDWIIRTPGLQQKTIKFNQTNIIYRLSLTAEKFGGVAASSDPRFNNGKRNPYAAVAYYKMEVSMEEVLNSMGLGGQLMEGSGGGSNEGQATGAKMFIDTASDDFSLVNFTLNFNMNSKLDATISGETGSGKVEGKTGNMNASSVVPLNMQLKKSGGGYVIVVKGVTPDGKDVQFPALLEKFPSDQDRRDAKDADKRRKAAEDKIKKQQEEMAKAGQGSSEDPLAPLVPSEGGDDALAPLVPSEGGDDPLAPLVPSEGGDDALAPLVPSEGGDDALAPLVPSEDGDDALAPLVPQDGDSASDFPTPKN